MTGSIEEAIPLDEQAIRLSPGDPYLQNYYQDMGIIYLLLSRSNEAIVWFEKARNPGLDWP
jgi:tetratricopeptide (TPR) repeat protein